MADFNELQRREAEIARNKENKARLAGVYAEFDTEGMGTVEFSDRINFGLRFVQKPFPAYAAEIDPDLVRDAVEDEDDGDVLLPQTSGFVTEWDRDEKGHYVGAWVAVAVTYPDSIPVDAQIPVTHYFTFTAVAIKEIPVDANLE